MTRKYVFLSFFLVIAAFAAIVTPVIAADTPAAPAAAAAAKKGPDQFWTVRCEKGAEKDMKGGKCEVFQRLVVKETGQRMVEMAVGFPEKKNQARGVIVLPLGVLLTEDVTLKIDEAAPFAFKVRYCSAEGCFAYVNLSGDVLDTMRKGTKATLSFRTMQGKNINVLLSLKDFGKMLKQVGG